MENKGLSAEQLNMIPHDVMVQMYLQQTEAYRTLLAQNNQLLAQNEELIRKVGSLEEKLAVMNQRMFGRKIERIAAMNSDQLRLSDIDPALVLNEAEVLTEDGIPEEPGEETITYTRKKKKGKREEDLQYVDEVREVRHEIEEEKLAEIFPHGYDRLPDEVYSDLEHIPERYVRCEHHIAVYAGKRGEGVVKADRPNRLFTRTLLTPSLAAAVFNGKYVNAIPLNRISEDMLRHDVRISRQVLAGWMIRLTDRYLEPVYRCMKHKMMDSRLIHCDESPFIVVERKKDEGLKNYMWVYHTHQKYGSPPIFIYDHHKGRDSSIPREFLKDFKGILVTDGYQVYHEIATERPDELIVAGCWEHAKRKFAELVKSLSGKSLSGSISGEAVKRITAIYHVENMCKDSPEEERLKHRQDSVKPLVDAYFEWLGSIDTSTLDKSGNLYKAINYSLNQEQYLRAFLNDPIIPMTNNDAERSIRKFCIGRNSWHVISTKDGARSSAILYSIAETARANGLKPYYYFKYLLEQLMEHFGEPFEDYLEDLMPWSDKLPEECRKKSF